MALAPQQSESERELVRKAAISPEARLHLREVLVPRVERMTKQLIRTLSLPGEFERELVKVGLNSFDRIFNIYIKNGHERSPVEGHFYAYYRWWLRKVISEYLFHKREHDGHDAQNG